MIVRLFDCMNGIKHTILVFVIEPYKFQIHGTRQNIIHTNSIAGYTPGTIINNDFMYVIEFNEAGQITKSTLHHQSDQLFNALKEVGLSELVTYGFAKSDWIHTITKNKRDNQIIFSERSIVIICLTIAIIVASLTICCIAKSLSAICAKSNGKVLYDEMVQSEQESENEALNKI